MKKASIIFFGIILNLIVNGQNESKRIMTSFVPKSNAYDIYYPKDFILLENDSEGIVTITDKKSGLNITVSSNLIDEKSDDEKLIAELNKFMKGYFKKDFKREDWNSYKTKFDILVELKISDTASNWIWYGIVNKGRMVLISMNKNSVIDESDIGLVRFMINNLIIN